MLFCILTIIGGLVKFAKKKRPIIGKNISKKTFYSNSSGATGFSELSVQRAKISTISECPMSTASSIGVHPSSSGALGLSVKGANILTISV